MTDKITLTLELDPLGVNLLLDAIASAPLPYKFSAPLLADIKRQGDEQMMPPPPADAAPETSTTVN